MPGPWHRRQYGAGARVLGVAGLGVARARGLLGGATVVGEILQRVDLRAQVGDVLLQLVDMLHALLHQVRRVGSDRCRAVHAHVRHQQIPGKSHDQAHREAAEPRAPGGVPAGVSGHDSSQCVQLSSVTAIMIF